MTDRICDGGRPTYDAGGGDAEELGISRSGSYLPSTKKQRRDAHELCGGRCAYCARELVLSEKDWIVEHVLSRSRGGTSHARNLVAACALCNRRKRAYTPGEWREVIAERIASNLAHTLALFSDYYADTAGEDYQRIVNRLGFLAALIDTYQPGFYREDLVRIPEDEE
jgi:hypothetical protein